MRFNRAGLICLASAVAWLLLAAVARAQPVGEVESIGFNNVYRPACWTPMVVKIRPNDAPSGTYQIHVKQRDLDNDIAVFTRDIALTGSAQGGGREQRFWMYFIPQPVNKGLPDRSVATLKDYQDLIEVYLCDENGRQLVQLPITAQPDSVDPPPGMLESSRGTRLIVAVSDGNSRPTWDEYRTGLDSQRRLLGVLENVLIITVRPRELPENPLGYDAVDALVWFDADPTGLLVDGGQRMRALEAWVRAGGHLVIAQNPNWQPALAFGPDLLPVQLEGVQVRDSPEPLRTLARSGKPIRNPGAWDTLTIPFRTVLAQPRDDAVVDLWFDETGDSPTTAPARAPVGSPRPFIVRRVLGCGAVTWIAQDLGDPALTLAARSGWANIWSRVLDLRDRPVSGEMITRADEEEFPPAPGVDLGGFLSTGLESTARVGLYIALAVVFFVVYWLVAGPGMFLFLAGRRQTHLSWFGFAALALAATLLTMGVVRLVLRGPPEVNHLSIVRGTRGEEGYVVSRFGLYIPRDGNQDLSLAAEPGEATVSTLAALPIHPAHLRGEIDTVGKLSYGVPVRDLAGTGAPRVTVPYRSTLKQFEARWAGKLPGRIEGMAQVDRRISGSLTNGTGHDLRHVYIAYREMLGSPQDYLMYFPEWKAGVTIDLAREQQSLTVQEVVGAEPGNFPGNNRRLWGRIHIDWMDYWLRDLRGLSQMGEGNWDDPANRAPRAFPMLSFFSRLQPVPASATRGQSRIELLRRGARQVDLSPALSAGSVVVLAEAIDQPMPIPLTVEGDAYPGKGRVLYQFVLPTVRPVIDDPR